MSGRSIHKCACGREIFGLFEDFAPGTGNEEAGASDEEKDYGWCEGCMKAWVGKKAGRLFCKPCGKFRERLLKRRMEQEFGPTPIPGAIPKAGSVAGPRIVVK